jgi:hypothetical protein
LNGVYIPNYDIPVHKEYTRSSPAASAYWRVFRSFTCMILVRLVN